MAVAGVEEDLTVVHRSDQRAGRVEVALVGSTVPKPTRLA